MNSPNLKRRSDRFANDTSPASADTDVERQLLDVAAHDLRAGLVPLKTYTQLLASGVMGPLTGKQAEALHAMEFCVQKQTDKIGSVLDMIKAEEDRLEIQFSSASLPDLINQALTSIRRDSSRRKISLQIDIEPGAAIIDADESRLIRCIVNLMTKSLKSTHEGQSLGVDLRYLHDGRARIRLWDTGNGCLEDDLAALTLDSKQQALKRKHDKSKPDIDLAPVHDIIALHNGTISFNTMQNAGTTILIYLPVIRSRHAESHAVTSISIPPTNALVVTEPSEADAIRNALARSEITTTIVNDSRAAVCESRRQHYALVIVSGKMAGADPVSIIATIAAQRPEDPQLCCMITDSTESSTHTFRTLRRSDLDREMVAIVEELAGKMSRR